MKLVFSTDAFAQKDRFKRFQDFSWGVEGVNFSASDNVPFSMAIEDADLGPYRFRRMDGAGMQVASAPRRTLGRAPGEHLAVFIVLEGEAHLRQGENALVQRPGDIVVLDERHYQYEIGANCKQLALLLPRARLERELGSARRFAALSLRAELPEAALAKKFLVELMDLHQGLSADAAARMASVGVDLLSAGFATRLMQNPVDTGLGSVLVQRAKLYVEQHLHDAGLDPRGLALALGCSLRQLQSAFHANGVHVSAWIWQRRLACAERILSDPSKLFRPIGDIAYGCGFSSQTHFSRRFREHFGLTPAAYRHGRLMLLNPDRS